MTQLININKNKRKNHMTHVSTRQLAYGLVALLLSSSVYGVPGKRDLIIGGSIGAGLGVAVAGYLSGRELAAVRKENIDLRIKNRELVKLQEEYDRLNDGTSSRNVTVEQFNDTEQKLETLRKECNTAWSAADKFGVEIDGMANQLREFQILGDTSSVSLVGPLRTALEERERLKNLFDELGGLLQTKEETNVFRHVQKLQQERTDFHNELTGIQKMLQPHTKADERKAALFLVEGLKTQYAEAANLIAQQENEIAVLEKAARRHYTISETSRDDASGDIISNGVDSHENGIKEEDL